MTKGHAGLVINVRYLIIISYYVKKNHRKDKGWGFQVIERSEEWGVRSEEALLYNNIEYDPKLKLGFFIDHRIMGLPQVREWTKVALVLR